MLTQVLLNIEASLTQEQPITEREYELIRRTAARTAKSWQLVERDDLEQELYLWALTHQKQIQRFRLMNEGALVITLKRLAHSIATKETRHKINRELDQAD